MVSHGVVEPDDRQAGADGEVLEFAGSGAPVCVDPDAQLPASALPAKFADESVVDLGYSVGVGVEAGVDPLPGAPAGDVDVGAVAEVCGASRCR